jgi:hypothetical protein
MANGNLAVCPLLDAGEGYGGIHTLSIMEIINNFQHNFVYKLHAENTIHTYLQYLDTSIFGNYYDHICSMRVILTLLAKRINETENLTQETIQEINREIAQYAGFIPKK